VGFSSWALQVGDERSLHVLRSIDSVVNAAVLEHDGQMIKRLGDGIMAVFPSADQALSAASWALRGSPAVDYDGYTARMRAGIHFGTPRPIGGDYIGVDVNIAARLCEAAEPNEVLVSKAVQKRIEKGDPNLTACGYRELVGVPDGLETFSLRIAASAGEAESTRRPA
jgi:class 3 adenylate cyclase